ncbi:MAG: acylphosphatase [Anaerolineae bacterium]|nr:acylphosphatase [Anaerolineae bacterium]
MDDQSRLHAVVEGTVQGVGFRQFVIMTAVDLDLTGWVRNTYEGNVEVVAEGRPDVLDMLLSALHRGPRHAYVTNVRFNYETASGEFDSCNVRSTV